MSRAEDELVRAAPISGMLAVGIILVALLVLCWAWRYEGWRGRGGSMP